MTPEDRIRLRVNPPNVSVPQGFKDLYFDDAGALIKESPDGVKEEVGGGGGTVDNASVNAAIEEDPAASLAAMGAAPEQGTALLENIEGLNRAFDDFMHFDVDSDASPHRLTLTGFADSMPGNPGIWITLDLQQRYGVGMLFTPNLGMSWNGANPTLTNCTADSSNFTRMPSACEYTIASGGSYAITTNDIGTNPPSAMYLPSGNLAEARVNTAVNTIPLPNGIQKVRVFYVKLPSAGTINVTLAQSQFSNVTGSANANAAEALGYIDLTPNDFFAPITLTVSASGGAVQFIGAAFMSGSGVGYWSSAKGSTKMDDQLPGLRAGAWNQVYKDLCTALGTAFVLHCQRATDAGTEATNAAANYQTFFDAYQDAGLGQVVFEEPHRDTENALTTDAINTTLRNLCAAERIAFFRSKRAVLSTSTVGLGWGDGDNIHRDSREWRYVSGVFLNQVGYFRSAFHRYSVAFGRAASASERFRLGALSRARQSRLIGRGGVFYGTTHSGSPYGNPSVAADTGFGWVSVAATAGHSAGVIGQLLGGASQLETSAGDITITGNGYRNLNLPSGGGHSAALVFGQSSTNITDITAITTRSFGLEFKHGTDLGGGLGATEYVRIWAHNGTTIVYSRWVSVCTSGGPSNNGISFALQWRKDLARFVLWCNGHNVPIFPRCSLSVPELASANTAGSYAHCYIRATGTGHTAGKIQWLELTGEFGTLYPPFAF